MLRSSVEKMGLGRTQKAFQSNYYTECRILSGLIWAKFRNVSPKISQQKKRLFGSI
jgi:hypothetical protein